jgi:hypothetical protein
LYTPLVRGLVPIKPLLVGISGLFSSTGVFASSGGPSPPNQPQPDNEKTMIERVAMKLRMSPLTYILILFDLDYLAAIEKRASWGGPLFSQDLPVLERMGIRDGAGSV